MPSRPRTRFDREALSNGKVSKMRTRESQSQLNAEELIKAGLERKQQIRKIADKGWSRALLLCPYLSD